MTTAYVRDLTPEQARDLLTAACIPASQVVVNAGMVTAWIEPSQAWRELKSGRKVTPIDYDGVKARLHQQGAHLTLYSNPQLPTPRTIVQFRVWRAA